MSMFDTIRIEDDDTLPEWPHGCDEVSSDEPQRESAYGWQTSDINPCADAYRLHNGRLWRYEPHLLAADQSSENTRWVEQPKFQRTFTIRTVYPSSFHYDGPTVTGASGKRWAYELRFDDGVLQTVIKR